MRVATRDTLRLLVVACWMVAYSPCAGGTLEFAEFMTTGPGSRLQPLGAGGEQPLEYVQLAFAVRPSVCRD